MKQKKKIPIKTQSKSLHVSLYCATSSCTPELNTLCWDLLDWFHLGMPKIKKGVDKFL